MIRKACYHIHMNKREELIKLKEKTGLSWRAFARCYSIPYRTMQDWQLGNREMPEYLLQLMIYKAETDKEFGRNDHEEAEDADKRRSKGEYS